MKLKKNYMGTHVVFKKIQSNQKNYFTKMERKKVFQGKTPK